MNMAITTGPVGRFFASPRRRRRLLRLGIAGAVLGGIVALALSLPNTSPRFDEATEEPGFAIPESRPVPMTPERRRAVDLTIHRFVEHALLREHPARAWPLATASFRSGTSRRDWSIGDLPVSPYPASDFHRAGWHVAYSYKDLIGADVTVMPKLRSTGTIWVYGVELRRARSRNGPRWLVDQWFPIRSVGGGTLAVAPKLTPKERRAAEAREREEKRIRDEVRRLEQESRLSRVWWTVPLALLALVVIVPVAVVVRTRIQARRAERLARSA